MNTYFPPRLHRRGFSHATILLRSTICFADHFREPAQMVSALRFATALLFRTLSAPAAHPNAEQLTGVLLCKTEAYQKMLAVTKCIRLLMLRTAR